MLPQNVDQFIRNHIRTVWDLELLLLLEREPAHAWTAEDLVLKLRASTVIIADSLTALRKIGFVEEEEGRYRYSAATSEMRALVQAVSQAYANFPAAVTKLIWQAPNTKIQVFADAFRLKKD